MTDVFTAKKRSEVMSKIRAKHTRPELTVRKFLFSRGLRYRLHSPNLPGKPDIVLKKYKTVVFVHGCFWHGHNNCTISRMPKTKTDYWIPKIEGNILRWAKHRRKLQRLGWRVIVIWECHLRQKKGEKILSTLVSKILS